MKGSWLNGTERSERRLLSTNNENTLMVGCSVMNRSCICSFAVPLVLERSRHLGPRAADVVVLLVRFRKHQDKEST